MVEIQGALTEDSDRRIAAIDIGSNSIRLVVARVLKSGDFRVIDEELETTRLARTLGSTGQLHPQAVEETIAALVRFRETTDDFKVANLRTIATCAVREAENGAGFCERVLAEAGLEVEVISSEQEALLAFRSVQHAFDVSNQNVAVVDIGGGSTEIISACNGRVSEIHSTSLGAVRLTERIEGPGIEFDQQDDQLARLIRDELCEKVKRPVFAPSDVYGTGGTFATLASMLIAHRQEDSQMLSGYRVNSADVRDLLNRLKGLSSRERREFPGLDPARADIIVAGLAVAEGVMNRLGVNSLRVHTGGVRDGVLISMLDGMADPRRMTSQSICHVIQITPPGRGAVAVVMVRGISAPQKIDQWFRSCRGRSVLEMDDGAVSFGYWESPSGRPEEVVVSKINDQHLEVCGHGGIAAPRRIVGDLCESGCEPIDWQSFLHSHHHHPFPAEAQQALPHCSTRRTAKLMLSQLNGAVAHALSCVHATLQEQNLIDAQAQLDSLIKRSRVGRHLTEPWQVVVAGPPNVGKSTLINALAGFDRSIVDDQPGTTRDVLIANVVFDGWPFELHDTAGLRVVNEPLESAGIDLAVNELSSADLILMVDEAGRRELFDYREWMDAPNRVIHVANKADLLPDDVPRRKWPLLTSATTGAGLKELIQAIVDDLIPDAIEAGDALLFTDRQLALANDASQAISAGQTARACELLENICPLAQSAEDLPNR